MNIVWFFIGMAVIGAIWAIADAMLGRRRRSLVDEALFERHVRALEPALGWDGPPLALNGRLRRAARQHWNLLRRSALAGALVEPRPHLRPVSRAIVDQLPANLKANWLLRSSQEQDELSERAYLAAISLAMVEASDAE
ncbi:MULTISPECIES: hypothetical protein [unclassified Devosia]|uniref:hypothetical protein n=1 Tax=unclassified Devosia TaxID=196773 RepID=UPI00086F80C6|nr:MULTISPECIES: hypothetical protein [unclassified Devosia]MBN9364465.1 hypothetical protein [Devosia sp.]ODS97841.1 MAG: hypothetical protein ABS47_00255 [Devosia sp. SCN 66-27]OJX20754.1 MAG: hypothetical protein BGO83_04245 [Devosia sp. 66-14]